MADMNSSALIAMSLYLVLVIPTSAAGAASRFVSEKISEGRHSAWELRDTRTGAMARIVPAAGSECTALRLPGPDGRLWDLLATPPAGTRPTSGTQKGIPIMFPWPGRIPDGLYEHEGQRRQLPTVGRRSREAVHGFVGRRPWHVVGAGGDDRSARLVCRISAEDCPDTRAGYPFSWILQITWELSESGLDLRAEVVNGGKNTMPFGFGLHPWLRAPLGESGRAEECLIQVPASRIWNSKAIENLTLRGVSGARGRPLSSWMTTVPGELSLTSPVRLRERPTVLYTGLGGEGEMAAARVIHPAAGLETVLRFSRNLGTVVVFKQKNRQSVCIEPWSCPPNVFNLAKCIGSESGLNNLGPGERWEARVLLSLMPVERGLQSAFPGNANLPIGTTPSRH